MPENVLQRERATGNVLKEKIREAVMDLFTLKQAAQAAAAERRRREAIAETQRLAQTEIRVRQAMDALNAERAALAAQRAALAEAEMRLNEERAALAAQRAAAS